MLITQNFLNQINPSSDAWQLVDLTKKRPKLNQILRQPDIQQAFHDATLAYWAVQRWDIFQHFQKSIPKQLVPWRGGDYVLPFQADGSDWRYMEERQGRKPLFWDYCLSRACHWMAQPNLMVAKLLYPKSNWSVFSSEKHTGVACIDEKLLFEPYFYACGVSAEATLQLLFGKEYDNTTMCEYHDEEDPYDFMDGAACPATQFWNAIDTCEINETVITSKLIGFLHQLEGETEGMQLIKLKSSIRELDSQSENLKELALRNALKR